MTAATRLAVFYATESKILRRKVVPDDDAQPGDRFLSGKFVTEFGTAAKSAITVVATVSGALSK